MNLSIVDRPAFSVIGIHGEGQTIDAIEWIQPLWAEAFERRAEIENYIKPEAWGLMSGYGLFLSPWLNEGRYLAGWEMHSGVGNAEGWNIWHIPAQRFATVECTLGNYGEALKWFVRTISENESYQQSGAIHEFYPTSFKDPEEDRLYLYMMISQTNQYVV